MRLIDADALFDVLFDAWGDEIDAGPANTFMAMINDAPTITPPPNVPLTLDELWDIDGEPVWCQSGHGTGWFIVNASAKQPHEFIAVGKERGIPCAGIESGYWEAYRYRLEEGTV